jgi:hypothetical protein
MAAAPLWSGIPLSASLRSWLRREPTFGFWLEKRNGKTEWENKKTLISTAL